MQGPDANIPSVGVLPVDDATYGLKELASAAANTERVKQAGQDPDHGRGRLLQSACSSDSFAVTSTLYDDAFFDGCYQATGNLYEYSTGTDEYALGDRIVQPTSGNEVGVHAVVGFLFGTPRSTGQASLFVSDRHMHVEL